MKLRILLSSVAILATVGCSSSGLSTNVQTLSVSPGATKATAILAPQKAGNFTAFAARESSFVERELRNGTADSIEQFQRFRRGAEGRTDATVVFDSIRHGVTHVGGGLYAPIVEADAHVASVGGKNLLRRSGSATSGEIHELNVFVTNPELYREAISIAARKLAMELTSAL